MFRHSYARPAALAYGLLGLLVITLSGCFEPPVDPNGRCLLAGTCECVTKADCPEGEDCINGQCDVLVIDAGPGNGELGAPCQSGADCGSGLCLPPGPGRVPVCTVACDATTPCPQAWQCKPTGSWPAPPGPDGGVDGLEALCVPPINTLCLECEEDSDCNALGDRCITGAGGRKYCARDCTFEGCPGGYACAPVFSTDGGLMGQQCLPLSDSCECIDLNVGLGRGCTSSGSVGTCYGMEICQADGTWAGCDAPTPAPEVCNGRDDDCNGLIDSFDPGIDVSELPAVPPYPACVEGSSGACVGAWACVEGPDGGFGWSCGAPDPEEELCNGLDDDCDGEIDETFLDALGQYAHVHHCGACGVDCEAGIANLRGGGPDGGVLPGAVACEVRAGAPLCVPKLCAPGYAPYPPDAPQLCLGAVGSACMACTVDADCGPFGDRCVAVGDDPGTWCGQRCDEEAPYEGCTGIVGQQGCCPAGYTCSQVGADRLCMPHGDTCTCSPDRAGATRACVVNTASATCLGVETCGPGGEWSSCDTSTTTVEVCDGADNDCDGLVDEPFKNTRGSGTYDTDEQCGSCQTNCKALWSPTIQHAIGGCLAGPTTAPSCGIVACTRERIPGGGLCQVDSDCTGGRTCHPLYRQCVRSCTTSADCGGAPCVNNFCTAACTSDAQCIAALGRGSTCNSSGTCEIDYQFHDADNEPTNGCECPAAAGVTDEPDVYQSYPDAGAPYVDRDCDLVDGVAATSLFVRAGAAGGNGSRQAPFGTISAAIAAFDPATHSAILVASGSYFEQVVLKNGVKLFGGYSHDFSKRDVVAFPTLIEAAEPNFANPAHRRGTVNAENITQPTTIAGFTIRGYDVSFKPPPGVPGKNSYAIYVKDSGSALRIANNHIYGGRGGDAVQGAPGSAGANGGTGGRGKDSKECLTANCANESQPGGSGGVNPSCPAANGTGGGSSSGGINPQPYQPPLGKNGLGGSSSTYSGGSNLCKYDCQVPGFPLTSNGGAAQDGTDGNPGLGGAGCAGSVGAYVGDEWVGSGGAPGIPGSHGTGGGGGGGGGTVINTNPPTCTVGNRVGDLGATGGGGGAGGCGGSAGAAGAGGGGSFGIFVASSTPATQSPVIEGNIIEIGLGGNGGDGGPGGYGGAGGAGGEGGIAKLPAWCAGPGGPGGRGGNGGAGGGGGGGCGGSAFAIGGRGIPVSTYSIRNDIPFAPATAAGLPGAGGASPAGPLAAGTPGQPGMVGKVISF